MSDFYSPPQPDPFARYYDAVNAAENAARLADTRTLAEAQTAAASARQAEHTPDLVASRIGNVRLHSRVMGGPPIDVAIATLRRALATRTLSPAQRAQLTDILNESETTS